MTHLPLPTPLLQDLPPRPHAYLVGGTVRDLLTQRRPTDIDILVDGDAAAFAAVLAARAGANAVAIGKAGLVTHRITCREMLIDVTGLAGDSLQSDLRRRDFTINAMAYDLGAQRLIDILGGREDIAGRAVRMVSEQAFVDDPLRLLRAFRIAAALDFTIDPETLAAVARHGHRILTTAGERLRNELLQLLSCPASAVQIDKMSESGLLMHLLPEMAPLRGCGQNVHHDFDVYEHTLRAYAATEDCLRQAGRISSALEKRYREPPFRRRTAAVLKYAVLLHDIGKPAARRTTEDGTVHFHGHARRSVTLAEAVHQRLRLSGPEREQARCIVANHGRPMNLLSAHKAEDLGVKGINRFFRECEPWTPEVLVHAMGDALGKKAVPDTEIDTTCRFIRDLLDDYFDRFQPMAGRRRLLGGKDLMTHFRLGPSPLLGEILKAVEEERQAGRISTREEALALAADYLAAGKS